MKHPLIPSHTTKPYLNLKEELLKSVSYNSY